MKTQNENNCIKIADQLIPWSFVARVHKKCGGDWDATIDCFWKARHCTGTNGIQRYIMAGFKKREVKIKLPRPYILLPSKERENGGMDSLRKWWDTLYERRKKTVEELKQRTDDIMEHLMQKFKMAV